LKIDLDSDSYVFPSQKAAWSWTRDDTDLTLKRTSDLLAAQNISPNLYAIMLADVEQRWCLHEDNLFWVVYFSERGHRFSTGIFGSVVDACRYLIAQLLRLG